MTDNSNNGSTTNTLRDRVEFPWNTPILVTLQGAGFQQDGRNGTEYRYFLGDHRIMWVPAEVHHQILRHCGSAPSGAELAITRHKTGRNTATWTVERVEEEPLASHIESAPEPPPPAPAPDNGYTAADQPAQTQPAKVPYSESLYTALCAAVRVAQEAEKFAQSIGRPLAFGTDDIRALAATIYISRKGRPPVNALCPACGLDSEFTDRYRCTTCGAACEPGELLYPTDNQPEEQPCPSATTTTKPA